MPIDKPDKKSYNKQQKAGRFQPLAFKGNIALHIMSRKLKQAVSPQKENSTFVKNVQLDD